MSVIAFMIYLSYIHVWLHKTIPSMLSVLCLYCFIVCGTHGLFLARIRALITIERTSILYSIQSANMWSLTLRWTIKVRNLSTITINLGSLALIEVYAILWKDLTNYWFVLTYHLIWISVHNGVSWVVQIIRNWWSVVRIKTGRVGIGVSIWFDSSNEIKTLTDVRLIRWHISIMLWTVTHSAKCTCVLICLHIPV